jgi:enoyl-CoA hydratase/carnithine racemase
MTEPQRTQPSIRTHIQGHRATVEIHNPSQRNALTRTMCRELAATMEELEAREDIHVIALRGTGGHFSAGVAINELTSVLLDPSEEGSTTDHLSEADHAITAVTKPTIALVEGYCMGGGWQIASACDFLLASDDSQFAITPAKLGIVYPRTGIDRLIELVGPAKAKYILFTGKTFTALQAQNLGLVAEVVPQPEFTPQIDRLIDTMLTRSRFSLHAMKKLVDLTQGTGAHLDQEWAAAWAGMAQGPDMQIGITAFVHGQRPTFAWSP